MYHLPRVCRTHVTKIRDPEMLHVLRYIVMAHMCNVKTAIKGPEFNTRCLP